MSSSDICCKGCTSYGVPDGAMNNCVLSPTYKNKQCPCITCLVKMICTKYSECEKLGKYVDDTLEI